MRLSAQEKMGYYPMPTEAVESLVKHLVLKPGDKHHILDPCAGKGFAVKQIAESVGIPEGRVYCIELDPGRGQEVRQAMPQAQTLSPCSFFSTAIQGYAFSAIFCNPPFDHELGGGQRDEEAFARACYRLLAKDGVFVMVGPFDTFRGGALISYLDSHFKEAVLYRFPADHCKYGECAYIGRARGAAMTQEESYSKGCLRNELRMNSYYSGCRQIYQLPELGKPAYRWQGGAVTGVEEELRVWDIPPSWTPNRFVKAGYTDEELLQAIDASPLNELVMGTEDPPIRQPPLPLERGHVAMLLASGALDGLVETPHGNHVVRGVATKIEVFNEEASDYTVSDDGETAKIKDVFSQQITLKVRAVDATGVVHTFTTEGRLSEGEDVVMEHEMTPDDSEKLRYLQMRTVANGCTEAEEASAKQKIRELVAKYREKSNNKRKTA